MKPLPARLPGIVLALALLFGAALALLSAQAALAAPAAQDEPAAEPLSLQLGEYVSVDMLNGETLAYRLSVPQAASYEVGIVD